MRDDRTSALSGNPGTLPDKATWRLVTSLSRPGGPCEAGSIHPAADLAEAVRIYGIRHWTEQGYKQVTDELGWADFQVRSDGAPAPAAAGLDQLGRGRLRPVPLHPN